MIEVRYPKEMGHWVRVVPDFLKKLSFVYCASVWLWFEEMKRRTESYRVN